MANQYLPNQIPRNERIWNMAFAVCLFAYGTYGVWVDDLYLPGRHGPGLHLHHTPAWVMYAAMLCACAVFVSVVVDHYDRRDNERYYQKFASIARNMGWTLFALSLLNALFS